MGFRISGLSREPFRHLFGLSDDDLGRRRIKRYVVDKHPGFPDRITMQDVAIGETVLLLNHLCQPADTPYRASHAIFVRERAEARYDAVNAIPEVMRTRPLSLRAYDDAGMMVDAELAQGGNVPAVIERLFQNNAVSYIHAHNAIRGCYSGRIDRA